MTRAHARAFLVASVVSTESVYRIIDVVGVSEESWEDAGRKENVLSHRLAGSSRHGYARSDDRPSRAIRDLHEAY